MKVTNEAVKFFNYSSGIIQKNKDTNTVCVVIRMLDDGTHKFYIDGQYPEDVDMDWYAITQPGWDYFWRMISLMQLLIMIGLAQTRPID